MKTKAKGFTLIELLVVIAIIAILAAILFPVFAQAREKARQSACLNNTKQMGVALNTYMGDWDEYYPASLAYPGWNGGHEGWMLMLIPQIKSWNVFKCPSSPIDRPAGLDSRAAMFPFATYSYNEYLYYGPYNANGLGEDFSSSAALPNPTDTAVIADGYAANLFHDWGNNESPETSWNLTGDKVKLPSGMLRIKYANGPVNGVPQSRHKGANAVFADTHAKYIPLGKFYCMGCEISTEGSSSLPGNQRIEYPVIHPQAKSKY